MVEKKLPSASDARLRLIEPNHPQLSIRRQCELLGLNRSTCFYVPAAESAENLRWMRLITEQHLRRPTFGSRGMTAWLRRQGECLNRKRVQRLMRVMGIEAIYPRPRTMQGCLEHCIFQYLLRDLTIDRPDQVWSTDITYVPMPRGFMYLTAVMDWYSPFVLAWQLSNSLEATFCVEVLDAALALGQPEIFNTDQGVQYTATNFVSIARGGHRDQHGWPRSGTGQRLHRAVVAEREVRMLVSPRLRDGAALGTRASRLPFIATSVRIRGSAIARRPKCIKREKEAGRECQNDDESSALELLSRRGERVYLPTKQAWQRRMRLRRDLWYRSRRPLPTPPYTSRLLVQFLGFTSDSETSWTCNNIVVLI